jgi:diguanylate cyclase (GGDEF)-like protein
MRKIPYGLSGIAVISSFMALGFFVFFISTTIINKDNIEKLQIEKLVLEKGVRIEEVISRLLYKTQALAAIVVQGNGDVENFEQIASVIVAEHPSILNVLLAPGGVVTKVFPLNGNESVVGLDYFSEGPGNIEARAAVSSGKLVFGGPFPTVQGGEALVGRLPVNINTPTGKQFWGLVSVSLKFPQILDYVGFEVLNAHGLAYELWRINPDTGEKQIIAEETKYAKTNSRFVERQIQIYGSEWYLKISPVPVWYTHPENLALIIAGFLGCFMVLFVMQNNFELRQMKVYFEKMSQTDPVTGIYNRRYLEENLKRVIISLSRSGGILSLLMIDVDLFKNYNDAYGHNKGDGCLKTIAEILTENLLRADDFVARYGGEEFVVVLPNTSERGACKVADKLRKSIQDYNLPHEKSNVASSVTISVGVTTGKVEYTYTGNDFIKQADKALYMSKQSGRNKYTYLDFC